MVCSVALMTYPIFIHRQQRLLRDQTLELERTYIGRERYLERLSTYSTTFITNITPVGPDQCAMHGWIDTKKRLVVAGAKIFRLSCEHCSYTLDVPDLTGLDPNFTSVKRIYSVYPSLLNKGHSEVCFWNTASCHSKSSCQVCFNSRTDSLPS
jgi:hypothetical protein